MADNKSTTQSPKPAKAQASEVDEEYVEPQWEAEPSPERDRTKRRMSEGVRNDLVMNGFALDPSTGDLLVSDDGGETVDVVPREKVGEELKRRTEELAEKHKAVTPEGPGL